MELKLKNPSLKTGKDYRAGLSGFPVPAAPKLRNR